MASELWVVRAFLSAYVYTSGGELRWLAGDGVVRFHAQFVLSINHSIFICKQLSDLLAF